ncbi:Nucleolar GTP-binding protein 1 [Rhodotorula toruloides]
MSGTINKAIAPVPTAQEFLDVILSKTQRKTPTVIRSGFKISRIRSFYMRKVKFTQASFEERLDQILTEFPVMDNLHPFLNSLLNVLYDKNHYKLALGQLNTARHLIVQVGKDYCRLIKFGDSLYRCKQLKKAALGRMATIMKRQKDPLAYLEQVRQHMSRLPQIDPTTRTLLICGYPNVGKSSFVNKVTRADVDVQPYAFTTKSLFVGHMDYKYLRWQVIDTPGVLDHPLEEMNTIEMQSITALAHLRACVLYFMDLSEQCGFTVEAQCKLYQSIKPLFANKPTFIVINKIDIVRPEDLDPERKAMLDAILAEDQVSLLSLSCVSEEGIMDVRNSACDALLAHRVEAKEKTRRVENVANRVRVAVPIPRDGVERKAFIPDAVKSRKAYDKSDPERRRLERDIEEENGGAGVHSVDLKKNYMLKNDEWKYDVIPEIQDGKNVADFIDPDILAKLDELEEEEERLEKAGFYDSESDVDSDEEAIRTAASTIRDKKALIRLKNADKHKLQNRPIIPRKEQSRTLSEMTEKLKEAGYDASSLEERALLLAKAKGLVGRKRGADSDDEMDQDESFADEGDDAEMDVDEDAQASKKRRTSSSGSIVAKGKRVPGSNRQLAGLKDDEQDKKAKRLRSLAQRAPNRLARAGEGDRHETAAIPKWLFSGKRKAGKTNHSPAAAAAPAARPPEDHDDDSAARWESIRQRWLTPRRTMSDEDNDGAAGEERRAGSRKRRPRDAVFQQRIHTLEQMLRASNAAATAPGGSAGPGVVHAPPPPILSVPSSAFLSVQEEGGSGAGSSGGSQGKEKAVQDVEEDEPDGGMAIRDNGANGAHGDPVHELKKVSESIFLAFKQGRPLKEPLPLSLVTSLLFRSWFLDGTIPSNYVPEPDPPMPAHRHYLNGPTNSAPTSAFATPLLRPTPPQRTPSLLATLSQQNSRAVTPLPTSPSSSEQPPPIAGSPIPPAASPPEKPGIQPLQSSASLDGMGASSESGKLKLDVLRGSRWRTEREIASGSDVI